jgi:hypothetical protein
LFGAGREKAGTIGPHDAIVEAQTPKEVPVERPEQKKTDHDLSDVFAPSNSCGNCRHLPRSRDAQRRGRPAGGAGAGELGVTESAVVQAEFRILKRLREEAGGLLD